MDTQTRTRQVARIAEWMAAVLVPGQVVEVRALDPFASHTFATAEPGAIDRLAEFAAARSGVSKGVYWTPNPLAAVVGTGKDGTHLDTDVERRAWLLVDFDPRRPKDANATEAEHDAAVAVARSVWLTLTARGFRGVVAADSGNGAHLMVPVDLANDADGRDLHKRFLQLLSERFGSQLVEIDTKTHNAGRIWKLPATLARKGPSTADRPHRWARFLHVPDDPHAHGGANTDALRKLVEDWGRGRKSPPSGERWATAALEKEVGAVLTAPEGERNERLNKAAFSLGQIVAGGGLDRVAVEAALLAAATTAGLSDAEARRTIRSGIEAGIKEPRAAPGVNGQPGQSKRPTGPVILRASEVTPRAVEWLWPGRIPLGKLTTFAGNGGLGKTFVLCDLTARVTRGDEWPQTGGECGEPGQVLFISGEDDPDDTLVPRLLQLNADLERVTFLRSEVSDTFTLADLKTLDAAVEQTGKGVRLVVIDPPTAYLGDVNDHKNAELRGLLSPLKTFAAHHHLSIIFNTHVTKPQGPKIEAMMRVMGSVAWVNAVRAAHMFAKDPDNPDVRRVFVPMKNNLGPPLKGLAFELVGGGINELPRLEWVGEVDTTADEAASGEKREKKRDVRATDWLAELFAEVDELPSRAVWEARSKTTVTEYALKEAKDELGIRARLTRDPDGVRAWTWFWPNDARQRWESGKEAM